MGHAVFVFGAAGVGKTTFCRQMRECGAPRRAIRLVNLDPACENADDYDVNLCDHITVEDVMENCDFGPNGALFYALQEACENLEEFNLRSFEEDYVFFDCPGQIELFLHSDIIVEIINHVKAFSKIAVVYLTDASNFLISNKHLYAALCATLSLSRLSLPVLNVISKAEFLDEQQLENILECGHLTIPEEDDEYSRLTRAIIEYIESNGMLDYLPLNWDDKDTVENVLAQLDNILQRDDDIEPRERENTLTE